MNKNSNKLIALLVTLSKAQIKSCQKFLASPYFNPSADLLKLFKELSKRIDNGKSLEKEVVWKTLFKGKAYSDVRFRKFTSDLYRLLQSYLVQEELQRRPDQQKLLYLQAIDRQYPRKIVDGITRNWEKEIGDPLAFLGESSDRYHYQYIAEGLLYKLARYDIKTHERSNFDQIVENLDVFYLAEKLRTYYSSRSTDHARQYEYRTTLIPEIIAYLRRNPYYRNYLPVAIYFYTYLMDTEPEKEEHFKSYVKLLLEHSKEFTIEEATELYTNALNYCSTKVRQGKRFYEREYLTIYQHSLNNGIEGQDQFIDPARFKNAIQIALRLKEYDWVRQYIQDFKQLLPEKQRNTAVNYNMAAYHFYQKNYRESIGYLSQVDYDDPNYTLNSRTMLLAAYYELDEYEALDSTFDAFSAYLNRHKELPIGTRRAYQNLISLTRKLSRAIPGDTSAIEKLRKELKDKGTVASLGWISEKLDELAA
ncbi:MAG: hypothetical protein AAGF87_16710 [Bacteroidota bacterium]